MEISVKFLVFHFSGVALAWLSSYLSGRTECVQRSSSRSSMTTLVCGVPQGSVLGPVLFIMYTADLPSLVVRHGLQPHLYAYDTQVYGSCRAEEVGSFINRLTKCVDDVALCMRSNRLQMNAGKTDTCGSLRRVAYDSYLPARYQSMATTYFRLRQLAISACTSTQTSVCADTLTSSLPRVMRRCANFVPFVDTCRSRLCNLW